MGVDRTDLSKAPLADVFTALASDPATGLTVAEAEARLAKDGANALDERKTSQLTVLFGFFWGPIPWMIEAAALMAAIIGDWGDFTIILALLLFNAALGFFEERQATSALAALKNSLALKAKVLRGGAWSETEARTLVPGDIVRIRLGDVVPADASEWTTPPFKPYHDRDGNIFAAGIQDTKALAIQYLEVLRRLHARGIHPLRTIHVTFIPGEISLFCVR